MISCLNPTSSLGRAILLIALRTPFLLLTNQEISWLFAVPKTVSKKFAFALTKITILVIVQLLVAKAALAMLSFHLSKKIAIQRNSEY